TVVPPDAVEISPGEFRWVDKQVGKVWIYNKTPFGLMRHEEQPEKPEPIPADWTVKEDGDSLIFERPWPFGPGKRTWTRKKSELTPMEANVWKRAQTASPDKD